ncbi:unnamed protein product [Heterobilharzia americana]|nr:unnamed protein product [Heterobilharzia americana]
MYDHKSGTLLCRHILLPCAIRLFISEQKNRKTYFRNEYVRTRSLLSMGRKSISSYPIRTQSFLIKSLRLQNSHHTE